MKTLNKQLLLATVLAGSITGCTSKQTLRPAGQPDAAQLEKNKAAVTAVDYRQEMRNFVIGISQYAKSKNPQFAIIPQNGHDLVTTNGESNGPLSTAYVQAIDAVGREDLLYGYTDDNVPTPSADKNQMIAFLNLIKTTKKVLVTDYCSSKTYMDNSYTTNNGNGYVSFAADHRGLDNIPAYPATPYGVNNTDITNIMQVKNFLYIIDPGAYADKSKFLAAIGATNYDLIIMDLFYDKTPFTAAEIDGLKKKANGGKRLVVSYLSIGEVENYRYYWKSGWKIGNPPYIVAKDPDWPGNFYCEYWNKDWQNIVYGNATSYVQKILDSHFDGAYLDLIDAFEFFENR
ncbi:MAG: endo alpha-1,4 polygalactosaminidase [Chitinophaga sp.]|uniref:endo alpha-1,4 polygalactosaminidase n=1 Tax=Chitinophaga sp. TaxID=1869181 RepID=UPI001AFFFCDF|nr:endo alpha-1,4 polygalactosaminidase [Chitinophaga sp.]MBO9729655.1 endo alpha-1,4 polygalactosaminidase [Chitinophaga sp.]